MKKLLLLFVAVFCTMSIAMAQVTVTGTIVEDGGTPLIGANVLIKNSTVGTITDLDGNFSLEVPDLNTPLVVSYAGFSTQEIDISGSGGKVMITMREGALLDEVVVTATGIERNSREISYANQTVSAEDLNSAPNKNALEALRGKTAGVKISTGSGSVGASSRIVLRGESSLTGNNNALIVVDGIPIDNETSRGGATTDLFSAQDGYADYGNRFNDLNPEDIESVTVLKGASATALYGSRGASGVLVITTKKGGGKDGKIEVGYNNTTSYDQAYVLLKRQDQYGQGYGLPFAANPEFDSGENWSWGPAFDGVVRPWTSPVDADGDGDSEYLSRPYSAVPNQLETFFRTGRTFTNNVNISGSKGGYNFYASYGNVKQYGILDATDYNRNSLKLAASSKLSEKLKADFSVSYSNVDQNTALEGYRPFEGQNAYANAVQSPVNIPFSELKDYKSPYHGLEGYYGSYTSNPYFILNEFSNNGKVNNLLTSMQLVYNPIERLTILGRAGINTVGSTIRESIPIYAYKDHTVWFNNLTSGSRGSRANNAGEHFERRGTNVNQDYTLQATYDHNLNESGSITLSPTVGWNLFKRRTNTLSSRTVGGLVTPGWYHLKNSAGTVNGTQTSSNYWLYGLYGQVRLGYEDRLFLDYSARRDVTTTLPVENNSFFYQSIGASAIVSEFLDLKDNKFMNFVKLRASYGTTGKDAPIYALYSTYTPNPSIQSLANGHDLLFPHNGRAGFTVGNTIGNPDLKPELTSTLEFGADIGFLEDKVNLEYTFYSSVHKNQIVNVNLAPSSGYSFTRSNIGEMTNKGHEVHLNLKPIAGMVKGLTWEVDLLYAKNVNKVVDIIDPENDGDELVVGNLPGNVSIVAKEGLPYGSFKGTTVQTNDAGQVVVGATGLPLQTVDEEILGSYQPDFTMSYGSTLGYKNFKVNVLFDQRKGGQFLSYTKDNTEFNGTAVTTLIGDRQLFVVENSVNEAGEANTVQTNAYDYLRSLQESSHLIDASYIKLRELGLSYDFGKGIEDKLNVSSVTLGLFAKNLKFWLPAENVFADPEINGPTLAGNATGIETTQTPPSKSIGVRLSVKF